MFYKRNIFFKWKSAGNNRYMD